MDSKRLETGNGLFGHNNAPNRSGPTSALDQCHLYNTQMKETEYDNPLTMRLNQFRLKRIGCDVMFVVGDEQERLLAHKLVLGCSSTVFNAMFYGGLAKPITTQVRCPSTTKYSHSADFKPSSKRAVDKEIETGTSLSTASDCLSHSFSSSANEDLEDEEEEGEDEEEDQDVPPGFPIPTVDLRNEAFNFGSFSSSSPPYKLKRTTINNENNNMMMVVKTMDADARSDCLDSCEQLQIDVEVVRVPDISPNAFNIMIGYIYSNFDVKGVALNDDNVMHTLYAAKKYDLRSLVTECVSYLLNGLSACNAVCLLSQARLFQEQMLLQQCFDMIDKNTDIALQSASVTEIDRDTLMEVLSRSQLDPTSELTIFHAAEAWAEAECERREIMPTVDNLRTCLGPALQLVRFPLMNVNEFGQAASSSLLNYEEIAEVFLHLTVRPRPYCRYPSDFRCCSRSKHTVSRFCALSSKRCSKRENKICFTADRDVLISGLGIYGMALASKPHIAYVDDKALVDWSCQAEIQMASVVDPCTYGSSVCHLATNNVILNGRMGDPNPCAAYFDEPVQCAANTTYVASIRFISETGVQTFQGKDGQDSITMDLPFDESVTFKFQSYRNAYGNDDGGKAEGQIPCLHFLVPWPANPKLQ